MQSLAKDAFNSLARKIFQDEWDVAFQNGQVSNNHYSLHASCFVYGLEYPN